MIREQPLAIREKCNLRTRFVWDTFPVAVITHRRKQLKEEITFEDIVYNSGNTVGVYNSGSSLRLAKLHM